MLTASISRNGIMLGIFAALTTAIIAGTQISTKERIAENRRQSEERALLEIVPKSRHDNTMLDDTLAVSDTTLLGLREEKQLYIARQEGEPVAVILPATAREGYTGDIDLIVGINADGSVAGVRVLAHRETPGLGDKVERRKSDWVDGFAGRSLHNPAIEQWKVKKDHGVFDQFTGATITPRAVTKSVKQALQYFQENRDRIFPKPESVQSAASEDKETNNG